ncbi:ATP-dependent DNA helicase [Clostridium sulfidigenes]|uniref:ATP-dependent DNA helicase n=1 Tax=Clostridium sulfidigenes TaxID=318464 RepID=A0A084JBV4_9CLOT|nr:AAA family ATPase [Clostridium sulfidigenes]KEZ86438.1 ATP-dependent DNA helicase [Clostridium sulfidigenes]
MSNDLKDQLKKQLEVAIEEERLEHVIKIINDEILKCIEKRKHITNAILEYRKNVLEEFKDDEDKIIEYFDHENYVKEENFKSTDRKLKELTVLKSSPYFGKVTFREEDYGIEDIYIGRFGVTLEETFEPLIIDWRAPISALFYSNSGTIGQYNSPEGEITASILGRVQYIIKRGKLEGLFNSNIDIKDDILQMVLSKNSSDKLKDIVMTIQQEQNEIIRQDKNKILVVDGVAGSGKTTIALHRVAYLIYNYRNLLENKVLILGPNRIFIDYISNVLPTLGETGVFQTTFLDLALDLVDVDDVIDTKDVMERILNKDKDFEKKVIYKRSLRFMEDLDKLVIKLEEDSYFNDAVFFRDKVIATKEEIKAMFTKDFTSLPLFRRSKKIKRILFSRIRDVRDEEFRSIEMRYKEKKKEFTPEELILHINDLEFKRKLEIRELVRDVIEVKATLSYLDGKNIEKIYEEFNGNKEYTEEDLVAILYLKAKLMGLRLNREIKHLVIDEAQDYSPLQFIVLKELVNTKSMTIVGDSNQQLIPIGSNSSLSSIKDIFSEDSVEMFKLNKSYRSTKEIMEYSNMYIDDISIVPMVRTGDSVNEILVKDEKEIKEYIIELATSLKKKNLENIAIITKNLSQSKYIYDLLKEDISLKLIDKENLHIAEGTMIMPSYYAKGLEFDGAIIIEEDIQERYKDNLMYIMCTRALHNLIVIKK